MARSVSDLADMLNVVAGSDPADPTTARAHERLGLVALALGRPRDALDELQRERRLHGAFPSEQLALGKVWQALGDRERARAHYRRQLELDPGSVEASDSLVSLEGR